MSSATQRETRGFQTEVKQLLRLMIHSLYSNREIFLRELISNASDACDKRRFEAVAGASGDTPADLFIQVRCDKEAKTLTVTDTGIGMTRQDVVEHLGTIAKSGTADFLSKLSGDQQKDSQLIGQFGVGFYSAFTVADRVEVFTRHAGAVATQGVHWESDGSGEFTVENAELSEVGTQVVLHLKDDALDFSDSWRLRSLIKRYSDHIGFAIKMPKQSTADDGKSEVAVTEELETINSAQALWTRSRNELKDEDYVEFYKHVSHDFAAPISWSHNKVEGKREYTTLLYLPGRAPFDLWSRDAVRGLKLYVKRVFILDDAEQFLPMYLRFVKGVVDSSDLPLNVSRELLQSDSEIEAMRAGIARKVLEMLARLAKEETDKYAVFWKEFGQVIKEGIAEDTANRERIAKLLRFASTHTEREEQDQSLDDYLARQKSGQKQIFYVIADTWNTARQSPHLERLRAKGIEVLLLTDRVDEWMMSYLGEYEGKTFQDVSRADLDLGDLLTAEEKAADEKGTEAALALCGRLREALSGRVDAVRSTQRLADSPACLVLNADEYGAQMRKLMEATGQKLPEKRPTLEINATHPLLQRLEGLADEDQFKELASVLLDQAILAEGGQLAEPAEFVKRLNRLLFAKA